MKRTLIQGATACVEGAIAAGCRFYAGYPITPSSEIMDLFAIRMPEVGGVFIQMEDEIATISAVIGAAWAGKKAMTATSGPGLALMQESISYAAMTETPIVIVDVQRAGPATGAPTLPSQGDVLSARYGGGGDYEIIALCPTSVQEMFDFTVKAFELAERFRVPTLILSDAIINHMREQITIKEDIIPYERKGPLQREIGFPFKPKANLVPPMHIFGKGYKVHITGLVHDETGFPVTSDLKLYEKLIRRLCDKINKNKHEIVEFETRYLEDAELAVLSYGAVARACHSAVELARRRKLKVGLLRLKTLWPFDFEGMKEKIGERKVLVVEMNNGQIYSLLRPWFKRCYSLKCFGNIPTPEEVYKKLKDLYG
jgi:2-oxoglutarate ferredoxin oxidoreductase subunit alpha